MRSKVSVVFLILSAMPTAQALAQEGGRRFSKGQEVGYLGETSRSAMARNVLNRLKNRTDARAVASQADRALLWHEIALDAVAIDHTPDPDTGAVDLSNGGPTRTSRALAMAQIAVFDAVNAILDQYTPYNDLGPTPQNASIDAAIAYAAYTTLATLYPGQVDRLTALLNSDVAKINDNPARISAGQMIGVQAAQAMLNRRLNDHADDPEPDFGEGGRVADGATTVNGTPVNGGTTLPFEWESDPLTPLAPGETGLALGAYWGGVTPFSLERGDQYRSAPPPEPGSAQYLAGYQEVQTIGASTDTEGSLSTPYTRFIGNFWGYDGAPLLGTPPRSYNQIAVQVARDEGIDNPLDMARYLAMINTALADAGIAAWDSKFYYNYWRPVTAIPQSDGVPETIENPLWKPVGISVINTETAITPTPPFPAYPSGHSTFGSAVFEIMREFFGNETRFTFISDEYNGEGVDPLGVPRPLVPVRFQSFDEAQHSNGISRIYNGVHWQWDNVAGQELGETIGAHVLFHEEAFQPATDSCPADLNGNGAVDANDLAGLISVWGSCDECDADLNADGVINGHDMAIMLSAWGPC